MNENHTDSNLIKGLLWGTALSIPLWLSFFGWIQILFNVIK